MTLKVTELKNGTVIDHIPAGKGLAVYNLLNGSANSMSVLLMNAESSSSGRKDMVKLQDVFVDEAKRDIIALVAPDATINLIKDGKVAEKHKVKMPSKVRGHLKCLNPKCITNAGREPLQTIFSVEGNPVRLKCEYCDKEYDERLVTGI